MLCSSVVIRPGGLKKSFFMLISTEYEISAAHKTKIPKNKEVFFPLSLSDAAFIMLINV